MSVLFFGAIIGWALLKGKWIIVLSTAVYCAIEKPDWPRLIFRELVKDALAEPAAPGAKPAPVLDLWADKTKYAYYYAELESFQAENRKWSS